MKKIMFLTMMFGLMMILSGSVSAQNIAFQHSGIVEPGKSITPVAGDQIRFNVHVRGSDGAVDKAGTRYMLISFARKNGAKSETIGSLLNLPQNKQDYYKENKATVLNQGTIKSVENPIEIRKGDKLNVIFYEGEGTMVDIENTREGKSLGKMRVRW